jgi:hypothetical protein
MRKIPEYRRRSSRPKYASYRKIGQRTEKKLEPKCFLKSKPKYRPWGKVPNTVRCVRRPRPSTILRTSRCDLSLDGRWIKPKTAWNERPSTAISANDFFTGGECRPQRSFPTAWLKPVAIFQPISDALESCGCRLQCHSR